MPSRQLHHAATRRTLTIGTSVPSTNLSRKTFFDLRSLDGDDEASRSVRRALESARRMRQFTNPYSSPQRFSIAASPVEDAVRVQVFEGQNDLGEHAEDLVQLKAFPARVPGGKTGSGASAAALTLAKENKVGEPAAQAVPLAPLALNVGVEVAAGSVGHDDAQLAKLHSRVDVAVDRSAEESRGI